MQYIVSMSYPNLRDIHHGFHSDPAKALAEYNERRDEAEVARETVYRGGTGRIVTVHEIIRIGGLAYTIDITAAELAVRAAKAKAQIPDLKKAVELLDDCLKHDCLGEGDAAALSTVLDFVNRKINS